MKCTTSAQSLESISCDCLVLLLDADGQHNGLAGFTQPIQDAIKQAQALDDLQPGSQPLLLPVAPAGKTKSGPKRVLVMRPDDKRLHLNSGLPNHDHAHYLTTIMTTVAQLVRKLGIQHLAVDFTHRYTQAEFANKTTPSHDAQLMTSTLINTAWKNLALKTQDKDKAKKSKTNALQAITFVTEKTATNEVQTGMLRGLAIANGMIHARELGDAPPNVCTPPSLAKNAKKLASSIKQMSVKVLGEKELKQLGAGAYLAVTQGSLHPPQLIIMDYRNGPKNEAPYVVVGKGLTFDSGGISLKPGAGMDEMKYDMCGAASVFGTMQAIADLQLPINVIGVVAAAENMPSASATRPGDIVKSMSGKTIEILNTDAEGRLVLCDTLEYVKRFKPQAILDLATLTGACIIALGHHTAAIMGNDQALLQELAHLSLEVDDPCWPLPLWPEYSEELKSNFADLPNIASSRGAGTIIAGSFLQNFIDPQTPWVHFDIAGVAWKSGSNKGATGRPVHLLVEFLSRRKEAATLKIIKKSPAQKGPAAKTKPATKKSVSAPKRTRKVQ